jgi:hypothetical protein
LRDVNTAYPDQKAEVSEYAGLAIGSRRDAAERRRFRKGTAGLLALCERSDPAFDGVSNQRSILGLSDNPGRIETDSSGSAVNL